MSGISRFKTIYSEGVSFDIGSGHNAAKRKAKIANLAARTTNPGEKAAAENKLKGPKLPSMKKEETELGEETLQDKKEREEIIAARRARVRELTQAGRTMTSARRTSEKAKERRKQNKTETIEKRGEDILRQILGHSGKVSDAPMGSTQVPEKQEAPEANRRLHPKLRRDTLGSAADRALKNEAAELGERHMTSAERRKEEALGKKTGSAKESMMKEYGAEKGEQIYYAWKRKKAMSEEADDNGFTKCWPGKKKKGFKMKNGKKVNNCVPEELDYSDVYEFVIETLISADFAQDYQTAENMFECMSEEFVSTILEEYIEEAKRSRTERRAANAGKPGYDSKGFALPPSGDAITARSRFDNPSEFHKHLKKHGINIPNSRIHYTGGMKGDDIGDKKVKVATALARIRKKKVKGWDVDETLFTHGKKGKPNVQVHVNDASGKRVRSLTNQEFNTDKLKPGETRDYKEFGSAKKFGETSSPNKKVIARFKKSLQRGWGRRGRNRSNAQLPSTQTQMSMVDDAAKVHKSFEAKKKNKPTSTKIKTILVKPNEKGEAMTRSYQATKEDFELWVNALIDEGYDLSELTIDELYEGYEEFLDEASNIVATAAPEPEPHRPEKKGPRKLNPIYKGIKKSAPKKEYKENFTPYEFWMNIIETQQPEATEEVVEEKIEEIVEEGPTTSYDYWKNYIEENANFGNN